MKPNRIQRQRTKGWRMPPNTIYVGRPTWFGNPFTPEDYWAAGYSGSLETAIQHCVEAYRQWLTGERLTHEWRSPAHFENWLIGSRDAAAAVPALLGYHTPLYVEIWSAKFVKSGYGPYIYYVTDNELGGLQTVFCVRTDGQRAVEK